MAEKEATIFILDLGSSLTQTHGQRPESDLDWSLRYFWDKITDVVGSNRKTLCVGVVGLRTDKTDNKLQDDDAYEHISVLKNLGPVTMGCLRDLQKSIVPSKTWAGDAISAIVVAVDMMDTFTKKLKYIRKIVLITDGQGPMDSDDVAEIAQKMNDSNIQLTVLGIDFDDPEYGFKEEDKSPTKAENEKGLKFLVEQCDNGIFASIVEAIDELDTPRIKQVKPYKTYDGTLTLGDPEKFPAALNINVERYFKTHLARPLAASTVVLKSEADGNVEGGDSAPGAGDMEGIEFSGVKQARTYRVDDPDAPGGKKDVAFEELAKGYEYGRTAVHISESEHNITRLETTKSFSILGFIPCDKYEFILNLGEACVTHAKKFDEKSELALSSLIWALIEVESYAVARLVLKDGKDPILVLLVPHVEPGSECLYDIPLPFAEDIRSYQFPPLDRVITVRGQELSKHRFLPSDELNKAMSDYVDAMDLSTYKTDEEGEPAEYAPIDESFNPSVHRINQAVKFRAIKPDEGIQPVAPILLRFAAPPQDLIEKTQSSIDDLIRAGEVKKVPPKAKGKRTREQVKPLSGLDVDSLLGEERKETIRPDNAVPDFKNMLDIVDSSEGITDAAKQMGAIIQNLITESFGNSKYAQALECFGVLREGLLNIEEPSTFNLFVQDLKKKILSGALGGDRREFWFKIRHSKLGLIDQTELEISTVTAEEAEEFYKFR